MTLYPFIIKFFFIVLLLELFLLGSGQFLSINGISLRMLFYFIAIAMSIILLINGKRIYKEVFSFFIVYLTMILFASSIGSLNGANSSQILENIKPLVFAFMIIPFSLFIINLKRVYLVSNLIKLSGLFMSVSLILLLLFLMLGYIDFNAMYVLLSSDANDFMMNNADIPRIFYKGFLYVCIAFIFYAYSDYKYKIFILSLLFIAILLTFTRGFLLALILSFIFISIIEFKKKKSFFILISIFIGLIIFLPFYTNIIGERDVSDSIRILQIKEVFDSITISSFFIGHGYGIGVPTRPNGMEITFLEIFHKQGILGLFLWIGFLFYMIYNYLIIKNIAYKKTFKPFLVSTFFVYFQSLTNPYLNNPIGMSMVLLAFSVLLVILNMEKKERMV
ncbi:O-antigen ligase family protein [Aliarcobacter cryaerophilus]|uniref:O-antigen ligase family protein n=1 Tax=Aliarcobacter cryaerophilus TaxID=28198 RepID=UPI00112F5033|nr:O-antigen ligase family protein [Aliarcobacter cryaerophilus]